MTLSEFKHWFDGYCSALPNKASLTDEQWAALKAKITSLKIGEYTWVNPIPTSRSPDKLYPYTSLSGG
jgi:hypothetical protein